MPAWIRRLLELARLLRPRRRAVMTRDLRGCPECDGDHLRLRLHRMPEPRTIWGSTCTHAGFCPKTGRPVYAFDQEGDCDHETTWCHHFPSCQNVQIHPCVNCEPGETPERCEQRFNELVAALQEPEAFPPNCT